MMRQNKKRSQAGFSLLEMLVVVAVLMIVMGTVFTQIDLVQKRYTAEEQRLDITQESREFFDEISRDLHQLGYPNQKMFQPLLLWPADPNNWQNDRRVAVGFRSFAYDQIQFEADIDGDGNVEVVTYRLQPDPNTGRCPCALGRSVVGKVDGAAQPAPTYNAQLDEVVNSGGANNGASGVARYMIDGYTPTGVLNDTAYAAYKNANVFTAFKADGTAVPPTAVADSLKEIRIVKVNLNLLTQNADMQSGRRAPVTMSASVRIPSNM